MLNRVADLRFERGADRVGKFKVPDAKFFSQWFCASCGAKVPRVDAGRDYAITPMGVLDDDPRIRPREHIFVDSKAPWFEIADALPQHPAGAPL